MLPANAQPWIVDGQIIGFYVLVKVFPDGAHRWRYKRIQGLCMEDFLSQP